MISRDDNAASATAHVGDGIFTLVVRGRLTGLEMHRLTGEVRQHPEYRDDLSFLADVRQCDLSTLTRDELRDVAALPSPFDPERKRAFVVGSDLGFGMARMFELMRSAETPHSRVFRDVEEARRWLAADS